MGNFALKLKGVKLVLAALTLSLALSGCSDNEGSSNNNGNEIGDDFRLADLKNPFIGKWEAVIPSMGNAKGIFEYTADGLFTLIFPDLPAEHGGGVLYKGGYLIKGNVQVSCLSWDDGIGGYTFEVINNNTISVTEIEEVNEDGTFVPGHTVPFVRVSGSEVVKEDRPFALSNTLTGKTWSETTTPYRAKYNFNADATGTVEFTMGGQPVTFDIAYSMFYDNGIDEEVLFTFMSGPNTFEAFKIDKNGDNAITATEILGIEWGAAGPAAVYGEAVKFTDGTAVDPDPEPTEQALPLMPIARNPSRLFHNEPMTVTLSGLDPDAVIYYTLDGTAPTAANGTLYTAPFVIPLHNNVTEPRRGFVRVRAVGTKAGYRNSAEQSVDLQLFDNAPLFGTYSGTVSGSSTDTYASGGQIDVDITLENGRITEAVLTNPSEAKETVSYWDRCVAYVKGFLEDMNSAEFDAVTGATRTSRGVKGAVVEALGKVE